MGFDDFRRRARAQHVVPVWRDCLLDTDTPVTCKGRFPRLEIEKVRRAIAPTATESKSIERAQIALIAPTP